MNNILGTIGGLAGLVVFLGAAVVYLRGSRDKGTITTLEASNTSLLQRVGVLEKDLGDARTGLATCQHELANARVEIAELKAQRPSADVLVDIRAELATHDTETRAILTTLTGATP